MITQDTDRPGVSSGGRDAAGLLMSSASVWCRGQGVTSALLREQRSKAQSLEQISKPASQSESGKGQTSCV